MTFKMYKFISGYFRSVRDNLDQFLVNSKICRLMRRFRGGLANRSRYFATCQEKRDGLIYEAVWQFG